MVFATLRDRAGRPGRLPAIRRQSGCTGPRRPDVCLSLAAFRKRLGALEEVCGVHSDASEDFRHTGSPADLYDRCSDARVPGPCRVIGGRACCSYWTPPSCLAVHDGTCGLSDCRAPHSDVPRVLHLRVAPRLVLVHPRRPTRFASVQTPKNCCPLVALHRVSTRMLPEG